MAITRSRMQLFLMESGDREIAPVEKALCENVPVPLVYVTRLHEADVSFAHSWSITARLPYQVQYKASGTASRQNCRSS